MIAPFCHSEGVPTGETTEESTKFKWMVDSSPVGLRMTCSQVERGNPAPNSQNTSHLIIRIKSNLTLRLINPFWYPFNLSNQL